MDQHSHLAAGDGLDRPESKSQYSVNREPDLAPDAEHSADSYRPDPGNTEKSVAGRHEDRQDRRARTRPPEYSEPSQIYAQTTQSGRRRLCSSSTVDKRQSE